MKNNHKQSKVVVILGAGVAGLTAKKYLDSKGIDSIVIEKSGSPGGHAQSHTFGDFVFDEGPHILFSDDAEVLDFLGAPLPSVYESVAQPANLWRGKILKHPAYLDLQGIGDEEIAKGIVESLLAVPVEAGQPVNTYEDWLDASQGKYVREEFAEVYTRKYWRSSTSELDVDWLGGRIHAPTEFQRNQMREISTAGYQLGCLPDLTRDSHYLTRFTYHPKGFWSLFPELQGLDINFEEEFLSIDLGEKLLRTSSREYRYEFLLNTSPLDAFIVRAGAVLQVPTELRVTSFVEVDLIVETDDFSVNGPQWVYLYDETNPVSRVSFPDRFSNSKGSTPKIRVQCEIYWDRSRESEPEVNIEDIFSSLVEGGLLPAGSRLDARTTHVREYGNIVPVLGRQSVIDSLTERLRKHDVFLAGRYGSWQYLWTVEAARDGLMKAKEIERQICLNG